MKPRQRPWKWLLLGLVALLLVGIAALPRLIGTSTELRDRVASALSAWTGATVTLTEPLTVRYFPPLSLRGGFVLTDATKLPWIRSIAARDVKMSLSLSELLMGRVKINALRLGRPTITLKADAAATAPADQTAEGLVANGLAGAPVGVVRVRRGTVKTSSGEVMARDFDARFDASDGSGALTALGSLTFRGETVRFAIDSGTITESEDGRSAPVALTITSAPVTAKFSGTGRFAESFELDGDMQADMADARQFLNWVGMSLPPGGSLKALSAAGPVHWNGSTLIFDDGTFSLDGNEAVGLLAITTGMRPRVEGTLAFERLVLDPYLGTGDTAAVGEPLFDWVLLKHFDADLRLSAGDLQVSNLELGRGGLTITAKDGAISSEVGELELCGGEVAGRVGLDLSGPRTKASLAGTLSGIAIETCLEPFAAEIPIKGKGDIKFDVSTGGSTMDALIRGLAGDLKVTAQNGAMPIDLPQLLAGAGEDAEGWSRDNTTPFESLKADCRLSAGHIWCQLFTMQTPRGVVSGSGGIDVGKQTLDWDFLIANPVAPLNASQLVMETPPRVTIRGPLTQPLIQRANRPTLGDGSTQSGPGTIPVSPR
ncbi:MAG TPA: AsmA family protein [Methyloceanibacter sp.]|nr:AsmA family protein [Methyloceanibacter sp.]